MTQAERIISRFGGPSALARALGHRNPTTVAQWRVSGFIPPRHYQDILDAAVEADVALAPAVFVEHLSTDREVIAA